MENQHTPGPWEIDGCGIYPVAQTEMTQLKDGTILRRGLLALPYERYVVGDMSNGANARLMVAAPDLLAALLPFAAILDELPVGHDDTHVPVSVSVKELVAARDAIRKATVQS